MTYDPDLRRFYSYADRNGGAGRHIESGMDDVCWPWIGSRTPGKQPQFWAQGTVHYAHVWIWERVEGRPKPPGMQLTPRCGWSMCVRPSHRELRRRGDHPRVKSSPVRDATDRR